LIFKFSVRKPCNISPPFLQIPGIRLWKKIEKLFLGIEGFEAFALASQPALLSESGRRIYNLAHEECAP